MLFTTSICVRAAAANGRNVCSISRSSILARATKTTRRGFASNSNSSTKRLYHSQDDPSNSQKYKLEVGAQAFSNSEIQSIADLYYRHAKIDGGRDGEGSYLTFRGVKRMLASIGETPDDETLRAMFEMADLNHNNKLHLHEFLMAADHILGGAPANVVLVVGGPGSGKGLLCQRLAEHCGCVHLSSGELLRSEVEKGTPLGKEVEAIMARGDLVSSAVITSIIRRRMRSFPGRRVLLDGFPRSLENARDFTDLMGKPELALHLMCDDTILMERILKRGRECPGRADDNVDTALQRLRTYRKSHGPTMEWLRECHVPIINLDCSGEPDSVWNQLDAIGRLMRPAVQLKEKDLQMAAKEDNSFLGDVLNGNGKYEPHDEYHDRRAGAA